MTDEDVQQLINRAFDDFWIVYRYTGIADAFLVQAHVPMEFEYRFFIVDGVPASKSTPRSITPATVST